MAKTMLYYTQPEILSGIGNRSSGNGQSGFSLVSDPELAT